MRMRRQSWLGRRHYRSVETKVIRIEFSRIFIKFSRDLNFFGFD